MDEDAPTIPPTMDEDAAPFSVNLAAIPDDNAATDRANSASSINAIAAPTLPSMDDARSNSVGIPPSMDDIAAPPDLANRVDLAAIPDNVSATNCAKSALSINATAVSIFPSMDDARSKSAIGIPPSMDAILALPDPVSSAGIMPFPRDFVLTLKILARVTSETSDECPKSRG